MQVYDYARTIFQAVFVATSYYMARFSVRTIVRKALFCVRLAIATYIPHACHFASSGVRGIQA